MCHPVLLIVTTLLLGGVLLQPYFNRLIFSANTPRPIEARGDLSSLERSSIEVFEAVAPSVLQVIAGQGGAQYAGGTQTGGDGLGRSLPRNGLRA